MSIVSDASVEASGLLLSVVEDWFCGRPRLLGCANSLPAVEFLDVALEFLFLLIPPPPLPLVDTLVGVYYSH